MCRKHLSPLLKAAIAIGGLVAAPIGDDPQTILGSAPVHFTVVDRHCACGVNNITSSGAEVP